MRSRKWTKILNRTVNIGVLGLLGFALLRPDGVVRTTLDDWRERAALRETIAEEWEELVAVGGRVADAEGGPVIVEFSDYECPFCVRAHQRLDAVLDSVGAGLLYLHFPLSGIHPAAEGAARASIRAERQGRFHEMHERLFETDEWHRDRDWVREAVAADVPDIPSFQTCLDSDATSARLARDDSLARRFDVTGTPTFVSLNGRHAGVPSSRDLARIVK